jgi:hypothetical protein
VPGVRKKTLNDLHRAAAQHGGKCLSLAYTHIHGKYRWRCAQGHEWVATANSVIRGTWCAICAGVRRENPMQDLAAAARAHGGECLTQEFHGGSHKYRWRCRDGHEWEARGSNILRGVWCPLCQGRGKSIGSLQKTAHARGGEFLSDEYKGMNEKYRWRCEKGHEWEATASHIQGGTWCPHCSGRVLTNPLAELQRTAKERGGECLSPKYLGATKKHRFRCGGGHEWEAVPSSVRNQGTWCRQCAFEEASSRQRLKNGLFILQELARLRGGECLSSEYINGKSKYRWRCADGHEWEASAQKVRTETWCPICSGGIRENLCRTYLQALTGYPWVKARPKWLRNERGNQMELDGYCVELNSAFEHHGRQHYHRTDFLQQTHSLEQRKADDKRRRDLCRSHNIHLLEVPYTVPPAQLPEWLHTRLSKWFASEKLTPWKELDGSLTVVPDSNLKELQEIAATRGGRLLDQVYKGVHGKLSFRCAEGHEWNVIPMAIKRGHWCPKCGADRRGLSRRLTDGLEQLQDYAARMGGECLSTRYVNANMKYKFRCAEGHEWTVNLSGVKRGTWCPQCKGNRISQSRRDKNGLSTLQHIAQERGGECLATEYVNVSVKYRWRCAIGHQWDATAGTVKRGAWCPHCMGEQISQALLDPMGMEKLQQAAQARGGECLAEAYKGVNHKYRWRCSHGHEWEASGANIVRGKSWCPVCGRLARAKSRRLGIEVCRQAAEHKGGACLSSEYVNSDTKLRWRCAKGHEWEAIPHSVIRNGHWCPICARRR